MHLDEALDQISEIHAQVLESGVFRAYPAVAVVVLRYLNIEPPGRTEERQRG